MTKKLSTDNQLLGVAREDLQLKRKVLDEVEGANEKHQKTMDSLLQRFTALASAFNNGLVNRPRPSYVDRHKRVLPLFDENELPWKT